MFGRTRRVAIGLVVVGVLAVLGAAWVIVVPRVVLERAKDPGLGVRDLHAHGVTGAGVAVAIIDGQLRRDHVEYADRLVAYDVPAPRAPALPDQEGTPWPTIRQIAPTRP